MKRAAKRLKQAQEKVRNLPGNWFGNASAQIEDLPSIKSRTERIRKNLFLDAEVVNHLEGESEKYGVPFTGLVNDILLMFVEQSKKNK